MTERYCRVCDGWHDLSEPWPDNCLPERNLTRSDLSAPMLISDTMNAARHPANGLVMDSKSSFRKVTKAHGLVEMGDQAPKANGAFKANTISKADVGRAMQKVRQGYRPRPLQTLTQ